MKNSLSQDEVVGHKLANIFCDFEAAGIITLESGSVFSLPGVLMTEVCRGKNYAQTAPRMHPKFLGATVIDLLRPKDLSDIYCEMQESVKLQLSSGICVSLKWWGMGPYLGLYDLEDISGSHQSFWEDFFLPNVPDWPDIRKLTCADVTEAEVANPSHRSNRVMQPLPADEFNKFTHGLNTNPVFNLRPRG